MFGTLSTWPRHRGAFFARFPSGQISVLHVYVAAIVLLAAGLSAAVVLLGARSFDQPWLLAVLAGLVALENVLSVRVRRRYGQGESLAHEEALVVFAALLVAPDAAFVAVAAGMVAGQLALRFGLLKAVFNVGQFSGSAALAFLVVGAVAPAAESGHWRAVLAALLGILVFSLVNRLAVAGVIALAGASSFREDFRNGIGSAAFVWLASVSIGLLAGLAALTDLRAVPFALAAMVVLSVAISGHARARRERQASTEIIRSAAAAVFTVDRRERIRAWNPEMERVTGLTAPEAVGRTLSETVVARRPDGSQADLSSPLALSDPGDRKTVRIEAVGGGERWLTLSRAALPDGGFAFVGQDVTEQRAAEEALRESEHRLRLALDAGRMGHWNWDLDSGAVRWSENLERIWGLARGSFGGTHDDFIARVHPDDRELVQSTIQRGLSEGRHQLVHRIVRPDGGIRWLEGLGRVVRDAEGRPSAMTGVSFDITERRRAEALSALQRQALEEIAAGGPLAGVLDRLGRLVEEESEGIFVSVQVLDEDGLRLRHGAAPSLPASFTEAVDRCEIGPQAGACGTAAHRREPVVVSDIASDPLYADVRELALSQGLRACWSTPISGSDGQILGTFAMYHGEPRRPCSDERDLAAIAARLAGVAIEHARQQERLAGAEAKYRRLVEQLPLGVYAFSPADEGSRLRGLPYYVNPQFEAMLGYSGDDWQADPDLYTRVVHADDRDRVRREIAEARASGGGFRSEYRMVAKDGRVVWVHDESVYLRGAEGHVVRVEGFLVDVTERKALESSLLQAQKMDAVGALAGGIAHDFNNLMSAVIGFGELALDRMSAEDPVRAQVGQMVRAGERASAMTNQLLTFSRKQVLQPRLVDLNEVVTESQKLLSRLIEENVELTCVLDPDLGTVEADPVQLEQVIVNLAVNARDAMPRGGRLTIETSNVQVDESHAASHFELEAGRYVLLAVTDTGIGMDAETRARVFEPFFTTKRQGEGTGLGLATVFGIVKQSGGDISVYSEPGRGTTFKLYLPQAERLPERREADVSRASLAPGSETILVAEDEELVRELVCEVLDSCGYTVLAASGPRQALELAADHAGPIDLLLTDVVMPELSGRELAERLTATRPDINVLYSSGYADDAIVRHGVLTAEAAFLAKPFTPAALTRKVRDVLDAGSVPRRIPAGATKEAL